MLGQVKKECAREIGVNDQRMKGMGCGRGGSRKYLK